MDASALAAQLDGLLQEFESLAKRSRHDDLSDLPQVDRQAVASKAIAAIHRIAGSTSSYAKQVDRVIETNPSLHQHLPLAMGVVRALRDDVRNGLLRSLVELVHAEVFADFLEMADRLRAAAYKDAAAVLAGSTLESHLRSLCQKANVPTDVPKADGTTTSKKAEAMNADLAVSGVYSKLDQKSVTAWLDLRNKAAHGKYAEYTADQVALLVSAIRDFVTRHPA